MSTLLPNPANSNIVILAPTCSDSISDCSEYGKSACVAPYLTWAKTNCASFCGLCSSSKNFLLTGNS